MIDLENARARWLNERDRSNTFGRIVASKIGAAVREKGIWCVTSSRAKETYSLIKKLLKGKHTYDTLPDKVGARCVVRYVDELEQVVLLATKIFACEDVDRKLDQLGHERVGYASIHIEVRLWRRRSESRPVRRSESDPV
jgi:ppGpp synthetase/RelA/SpoT-type nucleotidyltranferase